MTDEWFDGWSGRSVALDGVEGGRNGGRIWRSARAVVQSGAVMFDQEERIGDGELRWV